MEFDKNALVQEHNQALEAQIRREKEKRLIDNQEFKQNAGKKAFKNVLFPQFKYDERLKVFREVNHPPASLFLPIGWDEFPTKEGIDPNNLDEMISVRGNHL